MGYVWEVGVETRDLPTKMSLIRQSHLFSFIKMKRLKVISSIIILITSLSFLVSPDDSKKKVVSSVRWGLVGDVDRFVVDETEILVGEWLEYLVYQNKKLENLYVYNHNMKEKELNTAQFNMIKKSVFKNEHLPNRKILQELNLEYLFHSTDSKVTYRYKGLKGKIFLPVDITKFQANEKLVQRDLQRPIVGITYEQAIKFCECRSMIESLRKTANATLVLPPQVVARAEYYKFSLPSVEHFQVYTTNLDSVNKQGYSNFNYEHSRFKKSRYPYSDCGKTAVTPWHWYRMFRNVSWRKTTSKYWGLKHVQGNVSEMTNIKGISIGGSYHHHAIESYSDTTQSYALPQKWLGFRTVGMPIKQQ